MTKTFFSVAAEITAPSPVVWSVMSNVERWPEWTASISRVERLSHGPLRIGSRVRVHQPRLPPAYWRVTELNPEAGFTWVSVAPGVRVTARHALEATPTGCRVNLSVHYEGLLGRWLAWWTQDLNERYLTHGGARLADALHRTRGESHAAARGLKIDDVASEFGGDIDLQGFLGTDPKVRLGYREIRAKFKVKGDIDEQTVQELFRLSPVYDTLANPVRIKIEVEKA